MQKPIITLLSDFGLRDPYVAEMKAVILCTCPDAQIVGISHEIARFEVRMGAFVLASATPYFPKCTVHVAVVDPDVGTRRRPIVVETRHSLFVGPDNGLLMLAAEREGMKHVHVISNTDFMLRRVSKTFHGRDAFAPVAAHLANGRLPSEVGPKITDYALPEFAKPTIKGSSLVGEILHIDDFGNIVTNISTKELKSINAKKGDFLLVKLNGKTSKLKYCSAYGDVKINELLAVVAGHGFLEISLNQGNASEKLNAKAGMRISIRRT